MRPMIKEVQSQRVGNSGCFPFLILLSGLVPTWASEQDFAVFRRLAPALMVEMGCRGPNEAGASSNTERSKERPQFSARKDGVANS